MEEDEPKSQSVEMYYADRADGTSSEHEQEPSVTTEARDKPERGEQEQSGSTANGGVRAC